MIDTTKDSAAKRAALLLLSKGLITRAEACRLAGVSRQLMRHWTRGLQADRAREAILARLWSKALTGKR